MVQAVHVLPDQSRQRHIWAGDARAPGFLVSGGVFAVPGGSLTLGATACEAYVSDTVSGELLYAYQPAVAVGPLVGGNGTYWIAISRDLTATLAGWTRQSGTRYLSTMSATMPLTPAGSLIFAKIIVAGGVITACTRIASTDPTRYPFYVSVKAYGALGDNSTDDAHAFQNALDAGVPLYVPPGTYKIGTTLVVNTPTHIEGPFGPITGGTLGALLQRTFSGPLFTFHDSIVMRNLLLDDDGQGASTRLGAALYFLPLYDGGGAVSENHAPNSSMVENVRITSTNGDPDAWEYLVHMDGTGGTASPSPPIRRITFVHCQFFGGRTAIKTVWLNKVAHIFFLGGSITPAGAAAIGGITVSHADTSDVHLAAFEIIGRAHWEAGEAITFVGGRVGDANNTDALTIGADVTGYTNCTILGNVTNGSVYYGIDVHHNGTGIHKCYNQLDVGWNKANYHQVLGANAGNAPRHQVEGDDTDIQLQLMSKGAGTIGLNTVNGAGTGGFNSGGGVGTNTFAVHGDGHIYRLQEQSVGIFAGSGDPNGVQSANPGSIYLNIAGGANVSLYVKEAGSGTNTGWVAK